MPRQAEQHFEEDTTSHGGILFIYFGIARSCAFGVTEVRVWRTGRGNDSNTLLSPKQHVANECLPINMGRGIALCYI